MTLQTGYRAVRLCLLFNFKGLTVVSYFSSALQQVSLTFQRYFFGELTLGATVVISLLFFLSLSQMLAIPEYFCYLANVPAPVIIALKATLLCTIMSVMHVALWLCVSSSHLLIRWGLRVFVLHNTNILLVFLLSSYGLLPKQAPRIIDNPNTPQSSVRSRF